MTLPALLLTAFSLAPPAASERADRPNVVLILADDFGAERVSAYNPSAPPTPHLDALAAGGVRFTRCFSQPLCTPSRVELMTGRENARNYDRFGSLPATNTTFADLLRDGDEERWGYRTGVFGKWQLSGQGTTYPAVNDPSDWGFDVHTLWQLDDRPGFGDKGSRYWKPKLQDYGGSYIIPYANDYGPDLFTKNLLRFATRPEERGMPFLAYYPMALTHAPFRPTPTSPDVRDGSTDGAAAKPDVKRFPEMVAHMDALVGRIVAGLERAGLREDTVVIFLGDNGSPRQVTTPTPHGPYRGGKGQPDDTGTWVPGIVSWPGRTPAGVVDDRPVDFSDVLPTLCTLAGVPVPAETDGVPFLTAEGDLPETEREAALIWYDPRHGVGANRNRDVFARDRRYRLHADGRFVDAGDPLDPAETVLTGPLDDEQSAARARLEGVLGRVPALP